MAEEVRQGRSLKIKPSVIRKAHISAILSEKRVGQWVEEAIEGKLAREQRALNRRYQSQMVILEDETKSGIV